MLEDGQPPHPDRHEIEPLHNDQGHRVDGAGRLQFLGVVLLADALGHAAEAEPEAIERDAVALEVPVRHGKRCERVHEADETVRLDDQLSVDEAIQTNDTGWPQKHVSFGLLVGEECRGQAIGEAPGQLCNPSASFSTQTTDIRHQIKRDPGDSPGDNHQETAEHLRQPKGHVGKHKPELRKTPRRQQVRDRLLQIVKHHVAIPDRLDNAVKALE